MTLQLSPSERDELAVIEEEIEKMKMEEMAWKAPKFDWAMFRPEKIRILRSRQELEINIIINFGKLVQLNSFWLLKQAVQWSKRRLCKHKNSKALFLE